MEHADVKAAEFSAVWDRVSRLLPGYSARKPMMFQTPISHTLKGLYFEGSQSSPGGYYVWVFFQPLFVPSEHVTFNLGMRLGSGSMTWDVVGDDKAEALLHAIETEALPALQGLDTAKQVASRAGEIAEHGGPKAIEAAAYSLAYAQDIKAAVPYLDSLIEGLDSAVEWQKRMAERAVLLREDVLHDPDRARLRLEEWRQLTIRKLMLEDYMASES
jgi:hypothetical protein